MKTVLIGMSGGIDSSIAAYLLKKQGFNVIGITLLLWDKGSRCCDAKDIYRAASFAEKLKIKHYLIDLRDEFKNRVVSYFIQEYINGRTPNPCVICNAEIKFAFLFAKLNKYKADYIATGHYASINRINNNYFLSKAKDKKKSQEYFLARIDKKILSKILFPLSKFTKNQVRAISEKIDFDFRISESQELCFIKSNETPFDFILKHSPGNYGGNIVKKDGEILGTHKCYFKYTIGQRRGLGISDKTPYYVIKIDSSTKSVIVGKKQDVYKKSFFIKGVYWYKKFKKEELELKVRIRYNHPEAPALLKKENNNLVLINFREEQHAITPGQFAVFYEGDIVVGSGWII